MKKRNKKEQPIKCIVYLSTEGDIGHVMQREERQLQYISQYANGNHIEICKVQRRNIMGQMVVNKHFDDMVEMIRQGFADGILIANMRFLAVDEEDACKKIGKISKAGGAIYSVDDGKLSFAFKEVPSERKGDK